MLRCVAVFLCAATCQGIRLAPVDDLKVKNLAEESEMSEVSDGLISAAALAADVSALIVDSGLPADATNVSLTGMIVAEEGNGTRDKNDDDMAKALKSLKMETKVIKDRTKHCSTAQTPFLFFFMFQQWLSLYQK